MTRTTPEERGKIAFLQKEQKTVIAAVDEIRTLLLVQEAEINKLQKDNFTLKHNDTIKRNNYTTDLDDKLNQVQTQIIKALKDTHKQFPRHRHTQ